MDNKDHAGMVFLRSVFLSFWCHFITSSSAIRDKLGYALSLKWVKSIVLMMFTAYLVVAIWGITSLKEGLEKRNTVNFDSYSIPFFDADDKYYMVRNIDKNKARDQFFLKISKKRYFAKPLSMSLSNPSSSHSSLCGYFLHFSLVGFQLLLWSIYFQSGKKFTISCLETFSGLPVPDQRGGDGGYRLLGAVDPAENWADDADLRKLDIHQA